MLSSASRPSWFDVWSQQETDELKRDRFFEFMEPKVKEASVDDSLFVMTGLAAVIGKRGSGHIPYVKNMRLDLGPNVVFVPVFTLGAIVLVTAAQMSRKSATAEQNKTKNPKMIDYVLSKMNHACDDHLLNSQETIWDGSMCRAIKLSIKSSSWKNHHG
jgi:hypothetical protein